MTSVLRQIEMGLLATVLLVAAFANAGAQAMQYTITSSTKTLPAGVSGVSISAKIGSAARPRDFNLCFVTGYGSSAPIVPTSFTSSGGNAYVAFSVPASSIQQVPPSAFTSGTFSASLYPVALAATTCSGPAPSTAAVVTLNFPQLKSLGLPSAPQFNPNLSTRLPANITLYGTSFLKQDASAPGTLSTVSFIATATSPGAVRSISSTSLVSTIPTSIDPSAPSVGVQVCNTTALFSYCSNVLDLHLTALAVNRGVVVATPNPALPTQNVTLSATFGTTRASVAGASGGLVTFRDGSAVLGTVPLTLDSTGRFLAPPCVTFRASAPSSAPILADFNQDGVPDVLILDTATNTLNLILGSSPAATFAGDHPITPLARGAVLLDAAVADFNGDGFPDLAVLARAANASSNTVYTLLNDGSGNFGGPITAFPTVFGSRLLAADFDHDGLADLALAGTLNAAGDTGLQVLLGDGTGHFTAGPSTSGFNSAPSASFGGFEIATADLNGDGFPDIAILNGADAAGGQVTTSIAIFQNDGKGNFASAANIPTDGTASASFVLAPLGPGQLPAVLVTSSAGLAVANNQSATSIAFSTTSASTAIAGLKKAVFGDFNGDGLLDAAVDDGVTTHVLDGNGGGAFAVNHRSLSFASTANIALFAAADLNLDTYSDLMTLRYNGNSYTLQGYVTAGTASASFTPATYALGTHAITASTPGTYYLAGSTAAAELTIDIPTTVSVVSTVASSVIYGQPVTFSASVPDPTATGTVSFFNGGSFLGSATLVGSAPATARLTTSALPAGSYALKAVYAGDATHAGSTSSAISFQILQAAPTLAWSTPSGIVAGAQLTSAQLNATATGVDGKSLPGSFTYTPALGATPASGAQILNAVFTPADTNDYASASTTVTLQVTPFILSGLSSNLAILGDPAKTITLTGTGFLPGAVVNMGSTPISTTYINSTTLTAVIPSSIFLAVHTIQVTVTEPVTSVQNLTSASIPLYVAAPLAAVEFSGPTSIVSGTQITLQFRLTNPYPVPLTATFTLGFTPAPGLPADPNVLFSSGSKDLTVVIPAQSTASPQVVVQTGTIAGTLGVALDLTAGGTDVTPASVKPLSIQAPFAVPGITSVAATKNGNTLTVVTRGFSNNRQVLTAKFHFTPAPGATITLEDFTIDVSSLFTTWYADPASIQYGSEFTYTQSFDLSSDASAVGATSVTLINSVGGSAEATAP